MAIIYIAVCLVVFTGVAIGLQMLRLRQEKQQEAVRVTHRKNELMENHVRITDDFTRPRVYAHKKLNASRQQSDQLSAHKAMVCCIDVNDHGNVRFPQMAYLKINSLKILANEDLLEVDVRNPDSLYEGLHKAIMAEKYRSLLIFRIRTNNNPDSDFNLEGEELMALRETFELSDILKAENARQPRPEQK